MRLTPVVSSTSWQSPRRILGSAGLLAPSPCVFDDELYIAVGSQDHQGRSLPWLLKVADDLGDAEVISEKPLIDPESLPKFAVNGAIPTQLRLPSRDQWEIVFSGFEPYDGRYRLLSGVMRGSHSDSERKVETVLLLPPVPGQTVLRASSTEDANGNWVYAAGNSWYEHDSGFHPESSLWMTKDLTATGPEILQPERDEFALTRPVVIDFSSRQRFLFFSRRTVNGDYIQGLAEFDGQRFVRTDDKFQVDGSDTTDWMYCYPFGWRGQWWAAMAASRLGIGGFVLARVEVDA